MLSEIALLVSWKVAPLSHTPGNEAVHQRHQLTYIIALALPTGPLCLHKDLVDSPDSNHQLLRLTHDKNLWGGKSANDPHGEWLVMVNQGKARKKEEGTAGSYVV